MTTIIENILERITPQPPQFPIDRPGAEERAEEIDAGGLVAIASSTVAISSSAVAEVDKDRDNTNIGKDANGVEGFFHEISTTTAPAAATGGDDEEGEEVDATQAEKLSSEVAAAFAALASIEPNGMDVDVNENTNNASNLDSNSESQHNSSIPAAPPLVTASGSSEMPPSKGNTRVSSRKAKSKSDKESEVSTTTATANQKRERKAMTENTTEWKGEIGPDNAVRIDDESGEREWEISKICQIEEDEDGTKTIIVKWKGWKGFWPEEYDAIKSQVPELVETFEKQVAEQEAAAKRVASKKKSKVVKSRVERKAGKKGAAATAAAARKRGRLTKTETATATTTTAKTAASAPGKSASDRKKNRLRLRRLRGLRGH